MRRNFPHFLLLLSISIWSAAFSSESPPTIHNISIQGNTRTRNEVIRHELLIAVGEPLDSSLVAETARNLRRLFYLGNTALHIREEEGKAYINVEVQDLYARILSPHFSGQFNEMDYGLVALDYNFLGRGQRVELSLYNRAITGLSGAVYYRIPRLKGSRHTLTTNIGLSSAGHDLRIALAQPLYALSTRWAYGLSLFSHTGIQRLYTHQKLTARYKTHLNGASIWLTHSLGNRIKYRPGLHLNIKDHNFTTTTKLLTYAPRDRQRVVPSITLTIWAPRYEQTRFIHALGRTEDLQIGSWLALGIGFSNRHLGSDQKYRSYQIQLSPRLKLWEKSYSFITLFFSARHRGDQITNRFIMAEWRGYMRFKQIHSLALRLRGDALGKHEDNTQLLLGVNHGLRGYSPRRFDGSHRLLFNLEARPTLYRHPLFVLAGALFVDGGKTWTPGLAPAAFKLGVGAGPRIGLPRIYNTPVLRADLAYGVGDRLWQAFFGLGHYF